MGNHGRLKCKQKIRKDFHWTCRFDLVVREPRAKKRMGSGDSYDSTERYETAMAENQKQQLKDNDVIINI